MKKYLSVILTLLFVTSLSACGKSDEEISSETEDISTEQTVSSEYTDFDLTLLTEASKTSVLLEKYGNFSVNYSMDYGEEITQKSDFSLNADGSITYINHSDASTEYYDGTTDYWIETTDDGTENGYAYTALPGSASIMELENYIFTYSEDDAMVVTDYTQNDDGSYIISASESFTDSYEDSDGETVNISYKYEYVISATKDYEVVELKCTCTNTNTGEVDSTLDMKVDYGASSPEIPDFMDETFELTVITISGENEVTRVYEIPTGFMPFFSTPADGTYDFYFDREMTNPVEDTMSINYPCTIYAIKEET